MNRNIFNDNWDDVQWKKLCDSIFNKKCILFIGTEFPIEKNENGEKTKTSFSNLLSEFLINEFKLEEKEGFDLNNDSEYDLCQIASYCASKKTRGDFNIIVSEFLEKNKSELESKSFRELMYLPFTLLIDTNYSDFFNEECKKHNQDTLLQKFSENEYYNFKLKTSDLVFKNNEALENMAQPCIYNLFGSSEHANSLAITEFDLIDLLISIIKQQPGLPENLHGRLRDPDTGFLFIGFGLKYKDWYFRMLLNVLECSNKAESSFALESLYNLNKRVNGTVLFFDQNFNTKIKQIDPSKFIEELVNKYKEREVKYLQDSKKNLRYL